MYRPNHCTEAHCTKASVGDGKCAGHLFRWAFRRDPQDPRDTHTLAA